MNELARWKAMPRDERRLWLMAWLLLPIIALLLKWLGLRRTQKLLLSIRRRGAKSQLGAQAIARLVDSAARHCLVVTNCLPQSLVLWWWLCREGFEAELRIGVRKAGQTMEAHAWVELFGQALNNQADVEQRFAPFEAAILPPEVRFP